MMVASACLPGSDGAFFLESGVENMSVLELVHDGLLYPQEARKCAREPLRLACQRGLPDRLPPRQAGQAGRLPVTKA